MWMLGPLGFTAPWVLVALGALPLLWVILRAVPPAPIRRRFPAVALLLGLEDEESLTVRTPWWLLLLRALAVTAAILAFAGPVWRPAPAAAPSGTGPLVLAFDGGWASAQDWPARREIARQILRGEAAGRPVALRLLSAPGSESGFLSAPEAEQQLSGLQPRPWRRFDPGWLDGLEGPFDTIWISDGLAHPDRAALAGALGKRGALRVIEPARPLLALGGAEPDEKGARVDVLRPFGGGEAALTVQAIGPDPAGISRVLGEGEARFAAGESSASAALDLPLELRNRVRRFALAGQGHGGALRLTGDALRRHKLALVAGQRHGEGLSLLAPLHYIRQAMAPEAQILEGSLLDLIAASPDAIALADVSGFAGLEERRLAEWLAGGGVLLRFAGPAMARDGAGDPFLPVALRDGGRELGGAMNWGAPKPLAPFGAESPFYGLPVPEDVTVRSQVLAQPSADLAAHVIASLEDGTPLVTQKRIGEGRIILFHVTANADWSNLPLSGLFPQMLRRVMALSGGAVAAPEPGQSWRLDAALDAFGALEEAAPMSALESAALAGPVGPDLPPGLYAGPEGRWPVNVLDGAGPLRPASWPAAIPVSRGDDAPARALTGPLLALALLLLCLDLPLTLALSGRLFAALALAALALPADLRAESAITDAMIAASRDVTFAYVVTEDRRVNEISAAGLLGLGQLLARRTTIRPGPPQPVDLETDELAFYPLIYWPVVPDHPLPSPEAVARLRAYLAGGGVILFDTRDGDIAGIGGASPEAERLRLLAAPLRLPALEPLPEDHVLTRSFYLIDRAPGRYEGDVWLEARGGAARAEGMPFAPGNDGVSPVIMGGNDWAAAWAVDPAGNRLLPVGRGTAGERQRELAFRFGVNLAMYALTGNYKSDQVHVPALLDRLGGDDE